MNLAKFANRTHILLRFRRAMMMFWQPLILLAVIPTIITLAASLPFAVNLIVIMPLFGVAAYLAHGKYGMKGLVSIVSMFVLGCFVKLLSLIPAIGPIASRNQPIKIERGAASLVILLAMVVLLGAWAYIATRMPGGGMVVVTVIVVFVIISLTLGL